MPYALEADVWVTGHYWDPLSPLFLINNDYLRDDFRLKFIGDISCDIAGPIPSSIMSSTLDKPFFDYDPSTCIAMDAFSSESNVTMMTVDNLPCALPLDASEFFSKTLLENVIPELVTKEVSEVLSNSTILKDGELMPNFSYLRNFLEG